MRGEQTTKRLSAETTGQLKLLAFQTDLLTRNENHPSNIKGLAGKSLPFSGLVRPVGAA